jgi:hypothetical protein
MFKQPIGKPMQLVVYSNNVAKQESTLAEMSEAGETGVRNTAMILPFPLIKGTNRVKILDLSRYSTFFDDLDLLFPQELTRDTRSYTNSFSTETDDEPIPVQYVGSYAASIVPNFSSFSRLQFKKFNLSPEVTELLGTYYGTGFGFMVCILTKSSTQYHPFAYVHEIREDKKLFVPTRHYHRKVASNPFTNYYEPGTIRASHAEDVDPDSSELGDVDDVADYFYRTLALEDRWIELTARKQKNPTVRASNEAIHGALGVDWDHEIYVLNCGRVVNSSLLHKPGIRIIPAAKERLGNMYVYVDSQRMPNDIALGAVKSLYKIKIDPVFRTNCDLYL